jgi:hypothetical protein
MPIQAVHRRMIAPRAFGVAFLISIIVLSALPRAAAATITAQPTTFANALNGVDGVCSLAEAVIAANTNSSAHESACVAGSALPTIDQITVAAGTHYALDANPNDQTALFISEGVTITGAGVTTIVAPGADDNAQPNDGQFDGNDTHAFFVLADDITIENLTIDGLANAALGSGVEFRTAFVSNALPIDDLLIQNVTVQNIRRRGFNLALGTNARLIDNTILNGEAGVETIGIAAFSADFPNDILVEGNAVSNYANGIAVSATGGSGNAGVFTVRENTVTSLQPLAIFGYGLLIGSVRDATVAHDNIITLTDDATADIGVYVTRALQYDANAPGVVTVRDNTITVAGADSGVVLHQNGAGVLPAFSQRIRVLDNTIHGAATSTTALQSTGIVLSDEAAALTGSATPRLIYADLDGNVITGFYRGIHVRRVGVTGAPNGQPAAARVDRNTITTNTIGLDVEGHPAGAASAQVTTLAGDNLFAANGIGVRASANASVTLGSGTTGDCIIDHTTFGAQRLGGTLTITNAWWGSSGGAGVASNATDGTVTTTPFALAPHIRPSTTQPCQPSYGNFVWYDTNANGIQDGGEIGAVGIAVNLYDATGVTLLGTLPTAANGLYRVGRSGLANTVLEIAPGQAISPALQGSNPALDSNFDPITRRVTVSPNGIDDTIDAGIAPPLGIVINRTSAANLSLTDAVTAVSEGTTVGDQIAFRLSQQPTANVVIRVASVTTAQLRISRTATPQTLVNNYNVTFEATNTSASIPNWDEWVVVNIGALADAAVEGVHSADVRFTVVTGGAPEYDAMLPITETVTIYEPGIILTPYTPDPLSEGSAGLYTARLASPPGLRLTSGGAEMVTVKLVGYNINFIAPVLRFLTFTRADWDQPQTVNFITPDDATDRGVTYRVTIFHQPTSNVVTPMDTYYGGAPTVIANAPQRLRIADNDLSAAPPVLPDEFDAINLAAWLDGQLSAVPLVEGIGSAVVGVRLNGQPADGESVTVTLATIGGVTLSPNTLVFTHHNWDIYQPVTITVPANGTPGGSTLALQVTITAGTGETGTQMLTAAIALNVPVIDTPAGVAPAPPELPAPAFTPEPEAILNEGTTTE